MCSPEWTSTAVAQAVWMTREMVTATDADNFKSRSTQGGQHLFAAESGKSAHLSTKMRAGRR